MQRDDAQPRRRSRSRDVLLAAIDELLRIETRLLVLEDRVGPELTPEENEELSRLERELDDIEQTTCIELLARAWQRHTR